MRRDKYFWLGLRMAVVAIAVISPLTPFEGQTNADWRIGLLAGVSTAVAFSVWLSVWCRRRQVDLTNAFSLTSPFLPINRYPIRAWLLVAASITLAGAVGLVASAIFGGRSAVLGGVFLGVGLPLLATLALWGVRQS